MNYFEHNARTNPPPVPRNVYTNCVYIQASTPGALLAALTAMVPAQKKDATFMPRLAQQTRMSQAKLMNELVVFWGHERPEDTLARMDAAIITRSSLHVS